MKKILGAAVALTVLAAPAMAADLAVKAPMYKAPPPVPVFSWTGCYIGGNVGGGWRHTEWRSDFPTLPSSDLVTHNTSSWVGGVQAGCNYQFQNLVVGIEGNWTGTGFKDNVVSFVSNGFLRDLHSSAKSLYDIAGRVGFAQNNWLVYAKGGWAGTSLDFSRVRNFDQALESSGTVRASGYVVGVGVEYGITQNVIVGLEYDYYGFKPGDLLNVQCCGFAVQNYTNINHSVQTLTARLSFLFGPAPVVAKY